MPPIDAARFFMANAGQFVLLSSAIDPDRFADLRREMESMWIDADRSHAPGQTVIPNEYLRVTALRR